MSSPPPHEKFTDEEVRRLIGFAWSLSSGSQGGAQDHSMYEILMEQYQKDRFEGMVRKYQETDDDTWAVYLELRAGGYPTLEELDRCAEVDPAKRMGGSYIHVGVRLEAGGYEWHGYGGAGGRGLPSPSAGYLKPYSDNGTGIASRQPEHCGAARDLWNRMEDARSKGAPEPSSNRHYRTLFPETDTNGILHYYKWIPFGYDNRFARMIVDSADFELGKLDVEHRAQAGGRIWEILKSTPLHIEVQVNKYPFADAAMGYRHLIPLPDPDNLRCGNSAEFCKASPSSRRLTTAELQLHEVFRAELFANLPNHPIRPVPAPRHPNRPPPLYYLPKGIPLLRRHEAILDTYFLSMGEREKSVMEDLRGLAVDSVEGAKSVRLIEGLMETTLQIHMNAQGNMRFGNRKNGFTLPINPGINQRDPKPLLPQHLTLKIYPSHFSPKGHLLPSHTSIVLWSSDLSFATEFDETSCAEWDERLGTSYRSVFPAFLRWVQGHLTRARTHRQAELECLKGILCDREEEPVDEDMEVVEDRDGGEVLKQEDMNGVIALLFPNDEIPKPSPSVPSFITTAYTTLLPRPRLYTLPNFTISHASLVPTTTIEHLTLQPLQLLSNQSQAFFLALRLAADLPAETYRRDLGYFFQVDNKEPITQRIRSICRGFLGGNLQEGEMLCVPENETYLLRFSTIPKSSLGRSNAAISSNGLLSELSLLLITFHSLLLPPPKPLVLRWLLAETPPPVVSRLVYPFRHDESLARSLVAAEADPRIKEWLEKRLRGYEEDGRPTKDPLAASPAAAPTAAVAKKARKSKRKPPSPPKDDDPSSAPPVQAEATPAVIANAKKAKVVVPAEVVHTEPPAQSSKPSTKPSSPKPSSSKPPSSAPMPPITLPTSRRLPPKSKPLPVPAYAFDPNAEDLPLDHPYWTSTVELGASEPPEKEEAGEGVKEKKKKKKKKGKKDKETLDDGREITGKDKEMSVGDDPPSLPSDPASLPQLALPKSPYNLAGTAEIARLNTLLAAVEGERDQAIADVTTKDSELLALKSTHAEEIKSLKATAKLESENALEARKKEVDDLKETHRLTTETTKKSHDQTLLELNTSLSSVRGELENEQKEVERSRAETDACSGREIDLLGRNKPLEQSLTHTRHKRNLYLSFLTTALSENQQIEDQITTANSTIATLRSEVSSLHSELTYVRTELFNNQQWLRIAEYRNQGAFDVLSVVQRDLDSLRILFARVSNSREQALSSASSASALSAVLAVLLEGSGRLCETLKGEVTSLRLLVIKLSKFRDRAITSASSSSGLCAVLSLLLAESDGVCDRLGGEVASLNSELADEREEVTRSHRETSLCSTREVELLRRNTQLEQSLKHSRRRGAQTVAFLASAVMENDHLEAEKVAADSTISTLNSRVVSHAQIISERESSISALTSDLGKRDTRITNLLNQKIESAAILTQRNNSIHMLNGTVTSLRSQVATAKRQRDGSNHALNQSRAIVTSLGTQVDAVTEERDSKSSFVLQQGSVIEELHSTVYAYWKDVETLSAEITVLEGTVDERDGVIESLREAGENKDGEIQHLESLIETVDAEIARKNLSIATLQTATQTSATLIQSQAEQITSNNTLIQTQSAQILSNSALIATLQTSAQQNTVTIATQGAQILADATTITSLNATITRMSLKGRTLLLRQMLQRVEERATFRKSVKAAVSSWRSLTDAEESVESLTQEKATLDKDNKEQATKYTNLTNSYKELGILKNGLDSRITSLKSEIETLKTNATTAEKSISDGLGRENALKEAVRTAKAETRTAKNSPSADYILRSIASSEKTSAVASAVSAERTAIIKQMSALRQKEAMLISLREGVIGLLSDIHPSLPLPTDPSTLDPAVIPAADELVPLIDKASDILVDYLPKWAQMDKLDQALVRRADDHAILSTALEDEDIGVETELSDGQIASVRLSNPELEDPQEILDRIKAEDREGLELICWKAIRIDQFDTPTLLHILSLSSPASAEGYATTDLIDSIDTSLAPEVWVLRFSLAVATVHQSLGLLSTSDGSSALTRIVAGLLSVITIDDLESLCLDRQAGLNPLRSTLLLAQVIHDTQVLFVLLHSIAVIAESRQLEGWEDVVALVRDTTPVLMELSGWVYKLADAETDEELREVFRATTLGMRPLRPWCHPNNLAVIKLSRLEYLSPDQLCQTILAIAKSSAQSLLTRMGVQILAFHLAKTPRPTYDIAQCVYEFVVRKPLPKVTHLPMTLLIAARFKQASDFARIHMDEPPLTRLKVKLTNWLGGEGLQAKSAKMLEDAGW